MKTKAIVLLRCKCKEDAWQDYRWQSNRELCYLNAAETLFLPFEDYKQLYELNINNEQLGQQWAITLNGRHIGNCAAYNFDYAKGEAEIGIIIGDTKDRRKSYGMQALKELIARTFYDSRIKLLKLKTLKENSSAYYFFQKAGFKKTDESYLKQRLFIMMELVRRDWLSTV